MKKVIRKNLFESNSSSMHSIVITKNNTHLTEKDFTHDNNNEPYPDDYVYIWKRDGSWHLRDIDEGFGRWPFQILTTFEDKFKYALCEFCGRYYGDEDEFNENYHMMENLAKEIIPGFQKLSIYTKDIDIYIDADGNELTHKELKYDSWDKKNDKPNYYYLDSEEHPHLAILDEENYLEVPNIGSIDHQSMGLLTNFLNDKEIDLKEFLINKRYIVVIDSDEEENWDRVKRSGLIDMNFITEEYYG